MPLSVIGRAGVSADELIGSFRSSAGSERERARRRLVRLGSAAVPSLLRCLEDKEDIVRWEAAKTLKEIAEPSTAHALVAALADPEQGVRWVAGEAVIALGVRALPPLLEGIVRYADSIWFRESAHHILVVLAHAESLPPEGADVLHVLNDFTASSEHLTWTAHKSLCALADRQDLPPEM